MKTLVHGFAVSNWQDPEKWEFRTLKPSGVELLVARACRGATSADASFGAYRRRAHEHGLIFGASLELRAGEPVELQQALFDAQIQSMGGLRPGDLLPVLELHESSRRGTTNEVSGQAARRVAQTWQRRYAGLIVKYSSLFPSWMGAQRPDSSWAWLLDPGVRHWLIDEGASAAKPRTCFGPVWHLHQFGKRSLLEFAGGSIEIDVTTRNQSRELKELVIGEPAWRSPDVSTTQRRNTNQDFA